MKHIYIFLVILTLFACSPKEQSRPIQQKKVDSPIQKQIEVVKNTIINEPIRNLGDRSYFYNQKQELAVALKNATLKEANYDCEDFEKSLVKEIQTNYSSDFPPNYWQREELDNMGKLIAKYNCGEILATRAILLGNLQSILTEKGDLNSFIEATNFPITDYVQKVFAINKRYKYFFDNEAKYYLTLRQIFYPLDEAGYQASKTERMFLKEINKAITISLELFSTQKSMEDSTNTQNKLEELGIENLLKEAQEQEKVFFVFLQNYESIYKIYSTCIDEAFKGLRERWLSFITDMESLEPSQRQDYADKKIEQAKKLAENWKNNSKTYETEQF